MELNGTENGAPLWDGISGIVLDAVGTLIDPEPPVAAAYAAAALRQGVTLGTEQVRARFQATFRRDGIDAGRGALSTDEATERRRWRRIVQEVLPEAPDPDRAFDELWEHFGRPESWRCFPDAAPALEALQSMGLSVCIGSNFDGRLRAVVGGLPELAAWEETLVISSEVGFRKPHASFFQAACARLGLPPERALSVGDDLENDVRGATRSGLAGLLLDRRSRHGGEAPRVPSLWALVEAAPLETEVRRAR